MKHVYSVRTDGLTTGISWQSLRSRSKSKSHLFYFKIDIIFANAKALLPGTVETPVLLPFQLQNEGFDVIVMRRETLRRGRSQVTKQNINQPINSSNKAFQQSN